jgi:6-pyruvoyl-tetrahydropterin synthase
MELNIVRNKDPSRFSDRIEFNGFIDMEDIVALHLDALDRALLNDEMESPADYLLVMEMLFRRFAEQKAKSNPPA